MYTNPHCPFPVQYHLVQDSCTRLPFLKKVGGARFGFRMQKGGSSLEHSQMNWQSGQTRELLWKAARLHRAAGVNHHDDDVDSDQ